MSYGASCQSKWVDLLSLASSGDGPPEKRAPQSEPVLVEPEFVLLMWWPFLVCLGKLDWSRLARPAYALECLRSQASRAFWACRRFSASSQITLCGPSMTSAVTSKPRSAGRQCRNRALGAARAISCAFTWYEPN